VKNPIIVITGPTASGKTSMSLDLAKKFKGEIICADSMTVYRGMDIGTDKPTLDKSTEKINGNFIVRGITHHLIDIVAPDKEFNVSDFQKYVTRIIAEIQGRGKIPILVGGSTMYIDAFAYGYSIPRSGPDHHLRDELGQKSCEELFAYLITLDPDAEWTIDRHNKRRIIRALEVTIKTGVPFTHQKKKKVLGKNILYLAIERDRPLLYKDIENRVDKMMKQGFLSEVKRLFVKYDHNTAMQAAGYKQLTQFLDGKLTLITAIEKTKQVHRNYAKRQLTWLRRNPDAIWVKNIKEAESKVSAFLAESIS
jgi:tRNA dimethylallyltransferase